MGGGIVVNLPVPAMQVGDTFFLPCLTRRQALRCIKPAFDYMGYSFEIREEVNKGALGFRVWRIAPEPG